jgi:MFS family permease
MATAAAVNMAMGTLNFGLFIRPMGDELGIGRSTFGWATTARSFTSASTSPLVGGLLDRFGPRVLLPIATVITAGAMVGLRFVDTGWQLVLLFCVMGVVGMSGPGALVTTVPVTKWFVRNRGKAVAFAGLGIPIGSLIFLPLTHVFIDTWGWRTAWVVLAALGAGILLPMAVIFLRRQPEDMGLLPDGDEVDPRQDIGVRRHSSRVVEDSWTVAEAVRSQVFWRLVVVFSLVMLGISTVGVHRIPAFEDRGIDAGQIAIATALDAVAAGVSTFSMGMLVRRVPARVLGTAGFAFLAVASVLTIYATNIQMVFASMIVFGLGIGGMMFLQIYIWADYFGRGHLGKIRGLVMPITLIAGGAGAPIAGYVYDATGTYNQIWWAGVAFMTAGALVTILTNAPRRPSSTRGSFSSAGTA